MFTYTSLAYRIPFDLHQLSSVSELDITAQSDLVTRLQDSQDERLVLEKEEVCLEGH